MDKRNLIIVGLVLVVLGLIYFNRLGTTKIAEENVAYKALQDTTHLYKNSLGSQAGYISVVIANNKSLQEMLDGAVSKNSLYQSIIDSLKKDKNLQSASVIATTTKTQYIHVIDTAYKNLAFSDTVSTKWYDIGVHIKDSKLGINLDQRDELNLTTTKKDNKGWFTGSTLTTYASSLNPNTKVIGVVSTSTVVDKRKVRISPIISVGLNSDLHGKGVRLGYSAGIGLSF